MDGYRPPEVRVGVPLGTPVVSLGGGVHYVVAASPIVPVRVSRLKLTGDAGLWVEDMRIGSRVLGAGRDAGIALSPTGLLWRFPAVVLQPGDQASLTVRNTRSYTLTLEECVWWGREL